MSRPAMRERFVAGWQGLVRTGFRLLYNELAWTYDGVSWLVSFGQWRDWQRAAIPFLLGQRILELAHGPGHMLEVLCLSGYQVVGLDLSPGMGRLARRRLVGHGLNVPLVRGKAQELPFADVSFDSILATFPSEFMAESPAVISLYRVLKPGGRLVIVPEAQLTGRGPLIATVEWLYAVTGQRQGPDESGQPSAPWLRIGNRLTEAGFHLSTEQVDLGRSLVTIILAEKLLDGKSAAL